MTLAPSTAERVARARADLRLGLPVVLEDATGTHYALAVETLTPDRLAEVRRLGPPPVLALSRRRAETLKARPYDGDIARVPVPPEADLRWLAAVADPAADLAAPMKGPLVAMRDGNADPARAAVALVKAAGLVPAALVLPASRPEPELTRVPVAAVATLSAANPAVDEVVAARVPLAVSEAGRVHVFRLSPSGEEHYAAEIGRPPRDLPVLVRLHSACFTGDLLGSLKCDCGPQLQAALARLGKEGAGVLLYLNQEGRGIGLANKLRAYALQDQGFDTVEANHRLGFEDDERDFRVGAEILRRMGFSAVRLMTNNPRKVEMMRENGIEVVERVPLKVGETAHNRAYLDTKARKSGHLL